MSRPRAGLALALIANAALLAQFAFIAPASRWNPPVLLVSIAALGLVGCFNSVKVAPKSNTFLDAEFVAALIAVVLLGPLPALCVWLAGEVAYVLLAPRRVQAHLANIASYGCAAVAGALVLDLLVPGGVSAAIDPVAWLAVALAGAVVLCVNFAVTTGIVSIVMDGQPIVKTIREELIAPAPAAALMIGSGTATAFAYLEIGIPALILFSATVFLPRFARTLRLKPRPAPDLDLDHSQALPLYADRIAGAMMLGSAERLVVRDAASFIRRHRMEAPRGNLSDLSDGHRHALVETLLYKGEHWDGRGGRPGAVGGEMIPLTSRILAVADAWARLTTGDSPQLTHAQALERLEARSGGHFDPRVVEVAAQMVGEPRSCR